MIYRRPASLCLCFLFFLSDFIDLGYCSAVCYVCFFRRKTLRVPVALILLCFVDVSLWFCAIEQREKPSLSVARNEVTIFMFLIIIIFCIEWSFLLFATCFSFSPSTYIIFFVWVFFFQRLAKPTGRGVLCPFVESADSKDTENSARTVVKGTYLTLKEQPIRRRMKSQRTQNQNWAHWTWRAFRLLSQCRKSSPFP